MWWRFRIINDIGFLILWKCYGSLLCQITLDCLWGSTCGWAAFHWWYVMEFAPLTLILLNFYSSYSHPPPPEWCHCDCILTESCRPNMLDTPDACAVLLVVLVLPLAFQFNVHVKRLDRPCQMYETHCCVKILCLTYFYCYKHVILCKNKPENGI